MQEEHEWLPYPALIIGTFGFWQIVFFVMDYKRKSDHFHKSQKKFTFLLLEYKQGNMCICSAFTNEIQFFADSFEDFCQRIFTTEEEEELQNFIDKKYFFIHFLFIFLLICILF